MGDCGKPYRIATGFKILTGVFVMQKWHLVIAVLVVYIVGAQFPGLWNFAKSKAGF